MDNKILIAKVGGKIIDVKAKLTAFLKDFAAIDYPKILIHGGGNIATKLSEKMNIPTDLVDGRRITSDENLEVVTMVYAGLINKKISAQLQAFNCNAMGLSGCDANCITAFKRIANPIDFGWVGDVEKINTTSIQLLIENKITPVFSAICHDRKGQLLNTNADTITAEIAIAMSEKYNSTVVYCFEKQGVLKNINEEDSVLENIDFVTYKALKSDGIINQGMLPKLENSFHALRNKVSQVKIGNQHILGKVENQHTTITL